MSLPTPRIAELKDHVSAGGVAAGLARALLYVRGASGTADERGMEAIRRIRLAEPAARKLTLGEFKALIREQSFLLLIDEEAALATIAQLLSEDPLERNACFGRLLDVLEARGQLTPLETERLTRLTALLGVEGAPQRTGSIVPIGRKAS